MELLEFIFQSFWTWLGFVIVLAIFMVFLSDMRFFEIHIDKRTIFSQPDYPDEEEDTVEQ